jgi:putative peptidoglycan lipid II flippase
MNLLKSLAAVSSITMISRVLGFIRDTIIARAFGAGMATDAFFIAFKLPNLLRRIFAEGAFPRRLCPFWPNTRASKVRRRPVLSLLMSPGFADPGAGHCHRAGHAGGPLGYLGNGSGFATTPEKFELTSDMLRVTFPLYIADLAVIPGGAILNTWNRFSVPAFVPTC